MEDRLCKECGERIYDAFSPKEATTCHDCEARKIIEQQERDDLRDHFVGCIIQGIRDFPIDGTNLARNCYEMAEDLIKERENWVKK